MKRFKTLKDHVYDYIAEQIGNGSLLPGQRVNENIICEELNISRTPVREALIHLSAEGVLENMSRKGFVIRSMSKEDVCDAYGLIGILEGYAAKLACDNLTGQDLADMEFYIDAMDLAIKSKNFEMYYKQQVTFHQIYIDKCGNSAVIEAIHKAKNKLLKQSYDDAGDGTTEKVFFDTNREHREILELFKKKDGDGLLRYLSETHWTPDYAEYDLIAQELPEVDD